VAFVRWERHREEERTPCILVQNQNAVRDRSEQVPGVLFGLDLGGDTLMRHRGASFPAFSPGDGNCSPVL
jgi:hypothetical protein